MHQRMQRWIVFPVHKGTHYFRLHHSTIPNHHPSEHPPNITKKSNRCPNLGGQRLLIIFYERNVVYAPSSYL
jgi:hypothetical protein